MKNNKGFTLIELLGVIVILTIVLLVAIPNITSTFERNKDNIDEHKKNVILSAAEIYANRYKKEFGYDTFLKNNCGIPIGWIIDAELITEDELKNSDGKYLNITIDGTTIAVKNVIITYNNGDFAFGKTSTPKCSHLH